MARIVALGVALILLLATSFFAFSTHSKVAALNDQVTGLGMQRDSAVAAENQAKKDLTAAQQERDQAKKDADDAKSQLQTVQSNLDAATAQVTTLTSQVSDLKDQVQNLSKTGTESTGVIQQPLITQDELDKLNADLKDKTAQLAELTEIKETLSNKLKDTESRADDLEKTVERYKSNVVRNGLEGEVLAVNEGWSFVVLSIGDRQGAVANAEMILKRGDSEIGKVRITSVEPSTSVADIVPGSLARGVRVQPGDRVIFPGS